MRVDCALAMSVKDGEREGRRNDWAMHGGRRASPQRQQRDTRGGGRRIARAEGSESRIRRVAGGRVRPNCQMPHCRETSRDENAERAFGVL